MITQILNGFYQPRRGKLNEKSTVLHPDIKNISTAIEMLRQGNVVALPTETVYGLAADATNDQAVTKIFCIKNRPIDHPLIIHVAHLHDYQYWAILDDKVIAKRAEKLVRAFWPGPLTIILPRQSQHAHTASGGHNTLAIRCPQHRVFYEIAQHFHGIAAPSANPFGRISATTAAHVFDDFDGKIPLIIDGGIAQNGLESTVVSCLEPPRILRPGPISPQVIMQCLGEKVGYPSMKNNTPQTTSKTSIATSGQLDQHYAPQKPLYLVERAQLSNMLQALCEKHQKAAILTPIPLQIEDIGQTNQVLWFSISHLAQEYAKSLYQNMREMDRSGADILFIVKPEYHQNDNEYSIWISIYDRLIKASTSIP